MRAVRNCADDRDYGDGAVAAADSGTRRRLEAELGVDPGAIVVRALDEVAPHHADESVQRPALERERLESRRADKPH